MAVRGIFASHSSLVGDRRGGDFAGRILMNGYGGTMPMLALSSGMPKEVVNDTYFSWLEDSWIDGNAKVIGAQTANATTFTVDDTNIWIKNMVLHVESTGEQMFITDISGSTVTVIRGFANTPPQALADQERIQSISTAFAEATRGAQPVMQVGESRLNYVQIFKAAWSVSNTARAVAYKTGSKLAESKQQAMTQLAEQTERAFMFGRPSVQKVTDADGTHELRTSGGIQHAIQSYGGLVVSAADNGVAGRLNLTTLNGFIREVFDRKINGMPNERMSFTGSGVLEQIQKMVLDIGDYSITQGESVFGIQVVKISTFSGSLTLLTHPMFVANQTWNRQLWVLHPGCIKRKVLRDLEILPYEGSYQPDARDASSGHLRMEMGFEVKGVKTMGMITNIQSAGGVAALPIS